MHDLHIWLITSGQPALSAHILVAPGGDCHKVRRSLQELLSGEYGITHATLQVDHVGEQGAPDERPDAEPARPARHRPGGADRPLRGRAWSGAPVGAASALSDGAARASLG